MSLLLVVTTNNEVYFYRYSVVFLLALTKNYKDLGFKKIE